MQPTEQELKQIKTGLENFYDKTAGSIGELKVRMLECEQKQLKRPFFGNSGEFDTLAGLITESAGADLFARKNTPSFSVEIPARLLTKNTIINASGSAQPLVASDRAEQRGVVHALQQRLTVRGLFAQIPTDSNLIERPAELSFTNSAGPQGSSGGSPEGSGEGQLKNESSMTFELQQTAVATLAHFIIASRQILADAPLLQRHLETRLIFGLNLKEETQMLTGDGTSGNLTGIIPNAATFAGGVTNATRLDTLARAANQLAVGNFEPSGFILHPTDWLACLLEKDVNGRYVLGDPGAATAPRLWGLPVVPSPSQTIGTFVVLDALRFGYAADREFATIRISENVADQFLRNLITVLCENRVALVVEQGGAAVTGSLLNVG